MVGISSLLMHMRTRINNLLIHTATKLAALMDRLTAERKEAKDRERIVLKHFLETFLDKKTREQEKLLATVKCLQDDIVSVENDAVDNDQDVVEGKGKKRTTRRSGNVASTTTPPITKSKLSANSTKSLPEDLHWKTQSQITLMKRHYDDLESLYMASRFENVPDNDEFARTPSPSPLTCFANDLMKSTQYSSTRVLSTVSFAEPATSTQPSASIVSSIEFDKDDTFVAAAGVSKKIKIYSLENLLHNYNRDKPFISDPPTDSSTSRKRKRDSLPAESNRRRSSSFITGKALLDSLKDTDLSDEMDDIDEQRDGGRSRDSTSVSNRAGLSRANTMPRTSLTQRVFGEMEDTDFQSKYDQDGNGNAYKDLNDGVARYPVCEMTGKAKISCLSYNSYLKTNLLASDYEGVATLYDTGSGSVVAKFQEHEKRTWSVEYSTFQPMTFATGGDDMKLKIWDAGSSKSVMNIESKANICSVAWNPYVAYEIAFGSAGEFFRLLFLPLLLKLFH